MKKTTIFLAFSLIFILACSSKEDGTPQKSITVNAANINSETEAIDGSAVFKMYCRLCHGADGKLGTNGAKDLSLSEMDKAQRIEMIQNGKGLMTPFKEILSEEEIEAVAEYTFTFKND